MRTYPPFQLFRGPLRLGRRFVSWEAFTWSYARTLIFPVLLAASATYAQAQCPTVGADTLCGIVITITDQGSAISFTGQPPYSDGSQGGGTYSDTLIGVLNNSSLPIASLGLSSPQAIFNFTHNGLDTFGVPGNGLDQSGYGGPNAYFSGIDAASQNGLVNFLAPIPAGGGTGFFALATNLVSATACTDLLNGAVQVPVSGGTDIRSSFTPNQSASLNDAARICGFTSFNWQQLVVNLPIPSPFYTPTFTNLFAPAAFSDPPPTGYTYQYPNYNNVILPVYYNTFITNTKDPLYLLSLIGNQTATTLSFFDSPANTCLYGSLKNDCGYTAPMGAVESFSTHLVGVIGNDSNAVVQDTGIGFTWNDNFNGTSGGVSVLSATHPVDPGSGTGGVTITSFNPNTTYRYPKSLLVTSVNGHAVGPNRPATLLSAPQIAVTASGLAYSRATKTYTGTVNVTNKGAAALAGPFQIVLVGLTGGATLTNATGAFAGAPFLIVPGTSTIVPGQTLAVPVRFSDPALAAIHFSPVAYSGGFN